MGAVAIVYWLFAAALAAAGVEASARFFAAYTDLRGRPAWSDLASGKATFLPCAGWPDPKAGRLVCVGQDGRARLFELRGREAGALPEGEVSALFWSPDGQKLLLAGPLRDIHSLVKVYALKPGKTILERRESNLLGWLPDSASYLTHDSFENYSGEVFPLEGGRTMQAINLTRHPIDGGAPAAWGRILWDGPQRSLAQEAGTMAAVEWVLASADGSTVRARVLGRDGFFEGEAPSRGDNYLKPVKTSLRDFEALVPAHQGPVRLELR